VLFSPSWEFSSFLCVFKKGVQAFESDKKSGPSLFVQGEKALERVVDSIKKTAIWGSEGKCFGRRKKTVLNIQGTHGHGPEVLMIRCKKEGVCFVRGGSGN